MNILDDITVLTGKRAPTMVEAARLFLQRSGNIIVETGCFRGNECDGCSTLVWAMLARHVNGRLFSIDVNEPQIAIAKAFIESKDASLLDSVEFVHSDSVHALSGFCKTIDLLYLDSFDYDENNPLPSQMHQLAEVGAALAHLRKDHLILMDDYDLPSFGKCGLSVQFLQSRGSNILLKDYQILMSL